MKKFYGLIVILIVFSYCRKEEPSTLENYKPRFVVEGWIEEGAHPYVILTHNSPFFASLDSAQLTELIIRWAKVSVSDGEQTEVLTAKRDTNFFPPFIYKGTELLGQAGKTYTLKIEYAGFTLSAVTSIPKSVPIDTIWFSPKPDDHVQLNLKFTDDGAEKNYYRLYTRIPTEKQFVPTLLANKDDKLFNGKQIEVQVNRGLETNLSIKHIPFFKRNERVWVKLSAIPEAGFKFWSSFQDEILNASNPLIGSTAELKSNIQGQGTGIWCGYGSRTYSVIAK